MRNDQTDWYEITNPQNGLVQRVLSGAGDTIILQDVMLCVPETPFAHEDAGCLRIWNGWREVHADYAWYLTVALRLDPETSTWLVSTDWRDWPAGNRRYPQDFDEGLRLVLALHARTPAARQAAVEFGATERPNTAPNTASVAQEAAPTATAHPLVATFLVGCAACSLFCARRSRRRASTALEAVNSQTHAPSSAANVYRESAGGDSSRSNADAQLAAASRSAAQAMLLSAAGLLLAIVAAAAVG